jgi:hypothetical protein
MGWLTILRLVLSIANSIAEVVRDKQLLDAGEAKATAKALADTAETLGVAKAVKARLANASEAEIDDILKDDYRD